MKDKYLYPAIFEVEDNGGYCVHYPDLPGCLTGGDDLEDALFNAKEAFICYIDGEDDNMLPKASLPNELDMSDVSGDSFIMMIEIVPARYDEEYKARKSRTINKTVTMPEWLNEMALAKGLNFSHVLQEALKEKISTA